MSSSLRGIIETSTVGDSFYQMQELQPFHCDKDALTNFFGWVLQIILAGVAFSCLIGMLRILFFSSINSFNEIMCMHFPHSAIIFLLLCKILLFCNAFCLFPAKRFCEPKYRRRPWNIWWYDTSKQGIGAFVIHMTNVYLSPLFRGDPCTW